MNLISNLEYERNRYYKLKDSIIYICSCLNKGIENIDDSSIILDKLYTINDESVDNKTFKKIIKDIDSMYEVLNNTILPAINKKIDILTNDIKKIENSSMEKSYE